MTPPVVGDAVLVAGVVREIEPAQPADLNEPSAPAMAWVDFRETGECSWVLLEDVTTAPILRAAERERVLAPIRALHVPHWTDPQGRRHNQWVCVYTSDLPDDHVCRLERENPDDIWEDLCDPDDDTHAVLACNECRTPTDEGEAGYRLWPCATITAIGGPS